MSLQSKTIQRYRHFFPQDTLREVSSRTGIQITRVFRLFNGKTMKVGELEAFENAVQNKIDENPAGSRLNNLLEESLGILTHDELKTLADYIERKVTSRKYSRTYISQNLENAIIA